jgi:hypothetical protein
MTIFDFIKPRPEWKNSNWSIRIGAVEKLEDQTILTTIAKTDKDERVATVALDRLANQLDIVDVALNTIHMSVKTAAVDKLTDQLFLAKFAKSTSDRNLGEIATKKLMDQKLIIEVARTAQNVDVKACAVEKLTDRSVIMAIVFTDGGSGVKRIAREKLLSEALDKMDQSQLLEIIFDVEEYTILMLRAWNITPSRHDYNDLCRSLHDSAFKRLNANIRKEFSKLQREATLEESVRGKKINKNWWRYQELREKVANGVYDSKVVEIDNTSKDDNWITNKSNIDVTVACSEMFGNFPIDLHPGETKRITYNVKANVYPIGQYSYEDLKYDIGKSEKWEVVEESGAHTMVKVTD